MSQPYDNDRDELAAELAMRLLTGDELASAEQLALTDPSFAAAVLGWEERLAPLLDEVKDVPPAAGLRERVLTRVVPANDDDAQPGELRFWRRWSFASTALAASLALFIALRPAPQADAPLSAPASTAAPLVASMGAEGSALRLVATWVPGSRSLVVAAATEVGAAGPHSHQLWVIPADGKPRSLGLLAENGKMHGNLTAEQAKLLEAGATVALSVEPLGGSKTDLPTGPVIAAGKLETT
jgi:anti-sigma-K factor RskA